MKRQVFNPYLPIDTYIPDGEPHVFGDRVYIFGSHDKEGGDTYCMLDYEVWSAPVNDLTGWRNEGVVYRAAQDPTRDENYKYMYAPDVVKGNDGKYYLYYAMAGGQCFTGPIHVAVSDKPAGKYEYLGSLKNSDGSIFTKNVTFDPAVINDGGVIRLYYGWSLAIYGNDADNRFSPEVLKTKLKEIQMMMFKKTAEEVNAEPYGVMGAFTVELENDMMTVKTKPAYIIPGQFAAEGTSFKGHAFFEGSSIRKIGEKYYFIYSTESNHELCYAVSDKPDKDFVYGGVIISNGDIGYKGRKDKDRLAITGNNHGSIEKINGKWYVFYHRQTHKTSYSRQGCAESIEIKSDGTIAQVQMTSCGLNGGALVADGKYPAVICCNLTNGKMPHTNPQGNTEDIPFITHEGNDRYVADIKHGTLIGYKYFLFDKPVKLTITVRCRNEGKFKILAGDNNVGEINMECSSHWKQYSVDLNLKGEYALYLYYAGEGSCDLLNFEFEGKGI